MPCTGTWLSFIYVLFMMFVSLCAWCLALLCCVYCEKLSQLCTLCVGEIFPSLGPFPVYLLSLCTSPPLPVIVYSIAGRDRQADHVCSSNQCVGSLGRKNVVFEHGFHLPVSASRNAMYWHLIVLHICIVYDVCEPLCVVFGPIVLCLL